MKRWLAGLVQKILSLKYGFEVPDYDGMMNYKKCLFLWQWVSNYKGDKGTILEIGSWQGCSTSWLGIAGQRGGFKQLIAIDLFTGTPSWGLKDKNTYNIFLTRMRLNHLDSFVKPVVGDSKEIVGTLHLPEGISILHIDGDHEYSAVKADINNYTPFLNAGGICIIDDYDSCHPDVVRAADELIDLGKFEIVGKVKEIQGQGFGSIALKKIS